MPSSAVSMAPVPSAQVPRLRVLVAASREEEEEEWRGVIPAGSPGAAYWEGPYKGWC